MWGSLAPARRRLYVVVLSLLVVVAVVVAVVLVRGGDDVTPVAQDVPGPVLLVPGYGGSTASLEVLSSALSAAGKSASVVRPAGSGTQDLRSQASDLGAAVDSALASSGAGSVDLVGYSAGGVVVRYYVAHGGGSKVRRAITLASPHHGTSLASLAGSLGSTACPTACQQLAPDSSLLRALNSGDETPPGPAWVALWTLADKTVVPASSGSLAGAVDFSVQSVCPGDSALGHSDVPRDPAVIAMVLFELGRSAPAVPPSSVCAS